MSDILAVPVGLAQKTDSTKPPFSCCKLSASLSSFLDANEGSTIDLSGYTTEEDLKILVSAICE